jgi:hypothetical protein
VIPPERNSDFVAHMEDVLEVYKRPYDPSYPVICMDEQPIQLIRETRTPLSGLPGFVERYDFEYERNGTANHFMFVDPMKGWRKVNVRDRKTACDWAEEIKELVDADYPDSKKVVLVCDNLNTHRMASFYEKFPPEEARRLADRLEIHYTPKHGSWLNMAEIELSVLTKQCLSRHIPDKKALISEVKSWEKRRNGEQRTVDWRFTTEDARIKLKRLYPRNAGS